MILEPLGRSSLHGRPLALAYVADPGAWPASVEGLTETFCAFVALDASSASEEQLLALASRLIERGLQAVTLWGPDCSWARDLFDEAAIEHEDTFGAEWLLTTAWHEEEPLDESLHSALTTCLPADPPESYANQMLVAIVVGDERWADEIRGALADADAFDRQMTRRWAETLPEETRRSLEERGML